MAFIKARFTSKESGNTAGLVIESQAFYAMSLQQFSRLFPFWEAMKMKRIQISPEYATWDEAFAHDFDRAE